MWTTPHPAPTPPPSSTGLPVCGATVEAEDRKAEEDAARARASGTFMLFNCDLAEVYLVTQRYGTIIIDPPWSYGITRLDPARQPGRSRQANIFGPRQIGEQGRA